MIKSLIKFVVSIFSSSRASDTAIDIIRNATGANDLTDSEKLKFILDYSEATKHQSPTRRFIAMLTVGGFMLFTGCWLFLGFIESAYVFLCTDAETLAKATASDNLSRIKVSSIVSFRNEIYLMMKEVLAVPFSTVFGFYFVTQTFQSLKK